MNTQPFIIERVFNVAADKVWRALTDSEQMKQWYFNIPGFRPEVGFEFSFLAGEKNKEYLHVCKITEVVPGKKLAYSWRYDGYPGDSLVTFELFPEGNSTRLKLTHEGVETLGPGNPDFAKENFVKGWTAFMDTALKNFIEK